MIVKFYFADPLVWWKQLGNFILKIGDGCIAGHFAIGLVTFGEEKIYESVAFKSRKLPKSEWLTHDKIVKEFSFEVPPHLQAKVIEWLESMMGIRYAFEQIIFIAFCILFKPVDMIFNSLLINQKKALVCTELGSRFVENFMRYTLLESHDKIGLSDMMNVSQRIDAQDKQWIE